MAPWPQQENAPPQNQDPDNPGPPLRQPLPDDHHGLGAGWIVLIVILLLLAAGAGYYFYLHYRARKLGRDPPGLNPFSDNNRIPSRNYPARGGVLGWIQTQVKNLRNKRTAGGAYEGTALQDGGAGNLSAGGRRRTTGFGPLDPDEAWDTRVGAEADMYGAEGARGPYHGDADYGYSNVGLEEIRAGGSGGGAQRGRSRSPRPSELDERYDEEVGGQSRSRNPFGDDAAVSQTSLRGVSPRPVQDEDAGRLGSKETSPTERRSMFREDIR